MRKGMIQLWSDLEAHAKALDITWKVTNARKVRKQDPYVNADLLGVDLKSKGPRILRSNSTYYAGMSHIEMRFQPDFTPAYKAAIFAHEIGHHISQRIMGNEFKASGPKRIIEEQNASYHAYELLYSLTNGRVPMGCVDMFNISLASYDAKDQL